MPPDFAEQIRRETAGLRNEYETVARDAPDTGYITPTDWNVRATPQRIATPTRPSPLEWLTDTTEEGL